jgi:hypothetical protein
MNSESNASENYLRASQAIDAAMISEDDQEANRLWIEAAIYAEKCLTIDCENPEYNYLAGYTLSRHPIKSVEHYVRAAFLLERTLVINPEHIFALYCLACLHFEREKYELALCALGKVNCNDFLLIDQEWRCLIVKEMKLCSLLYLKPDIFPENAAEDVRQSYLNFDPVLAPVPWNLLTCIDYLINNNASVIREEQLLAIPKCIIERSNLKKIVQERFYAVYEYLNEREGKP